MAAEKPGKRVLFVAFHFPPLHGSSGILRTLKFVRNLRNLGYRPMVLTAHPRVYEATSGALMTQIPADVEVFRPLAMNVKKDLSFRGRYFSFTAVPDRFAAWIPFAVVRGLLLAWTRRIDYLISTYPIPSAHVIGLLLARLTGIPWIADMRDPMWDEYFKPQLPAELSARRSIEASAVRHSRRVLVTTRGMKAFFQARYPDQAPEKFVVISNGYDEEDFQGVTLRPRQPGAPVRLVHMGLLEPIDRNPIPFFQSVRRALDRDPGLGGCIRVELYAPGHEDAYGKAIADLGLSEIVHLLPSLSYQKAIETMAACDVLLLFQGPSCEDQIPAKLYEYMRVGRPVLAMTTRTGETGRTVLETGSGTVVSPTDPIEISEILEFWVRGILEGKPMPGATREVSKAYSRQSQAEQLVECLRGI